MIAAQRIGRQIWHSKYARAIKVFMREENQLPPVYNQAQSRSKWQAYVGSTPRCRRHPGEHAGAAQRTGAGHHSTDSQRFYGSWRSRGYAPKSLNPPRYRQRPGASAFPCRAAHWSRPPPALPSPRFRPPCSASPPAAAAPLSSIPIAIKFPFSTDEVQDLAQHCDELLQLRRH